VARTVLSRLNLNPVVAADAMGGLVQAVENKARLRTVITDLHMPQMDGIAFVAALRRILPDIPIIIASGRFETPPDALIRKAGVQGLLQKPFTEEMLRRALSEALSPRRSPA
jgi:CheY-like chemotaxis protein